MCSTFSTNGVGMGHYASHTPAMALKRKDPSIEIVFFTTNYVLHPLYSEGMSAYHLPTVKSSKIWMRERGTYSAINVEKRFLGPPPFYFHIRWAYPYR